MNTSSPSTFFNGGVIAFVYLEKTRAVVQGIQSDGVEISGKSTDEHQLTIKGFPAIPPMNFVEVIGITDGYQSVHAEKWTYVDNAFDASSHNQLCKLASREFKALFI